jgi:diguanylate cyclase (GGDEF)-like protein/PAS domain S-box-containing protein
MDLLATFTLITTVLATAVSASLSYYAWRNRHLPAAEAFSALMLIATTWTLTSGMELLARSLVWLIVANILGFTCVSLAPVAWLVFAVQYTGRQRWLPPRRIGALLVIPTFTQVVLWSSLRNAWFLPSLQVENLDGFYRVVGFTPGPYYWVHFAYSYLLLVLGSLLILNLAIHSFHPYRQQAITLAIGVLLPLVTTLMRSLPFVPREFNANPLGFALAGLIFAWGMFRYRLFDLAPVARDALVENTSDGIIVLDRQNRVVDVNPAAFRALDLDREQVIGLPVTSILKPELTERFLGLQALQTEISLKRGGKDLFYEVHINPLLNRRQKHNGWLIVFRDVTERTELFAAMQRLATTDSLTGLFNRRYFFEQGSVEILRAQRFSRPLSLIMLDIDGFKGVNDEYGHAVGDQVLQGLAELCRSQLRQADILARYGGEEFVFLLPESDLGRAGRVADRLCREIRKRRFDSEAGPLSISASLGVASLDPKKDMTLDELLVRADQALYQAKRAGRGRAMRWPGIA